MVSTGAPPCSSSCPAPSRAQSGERIGESRHPFDTKRAVSSACERLLDQPRIGRIVRDEKDGGRGIVHGRQMPVSPNQVRTMA